VTSSWFLIPEVCLSISLKTATFLARRILHHDNAPYNLAFSVKRKLSTSVGTSPKSLDLVTCSSLCSRNWN